IGELRVDIYCEVDIKSHAVLEVQFGWCDHKHVGQILTYGANGNAKVRVLLAEGFSNDHLTALNEQNRAGGDGPNYYAVTVGEEWSYQDSWIPSFRVVAWPERWELMRLNKRKQNFLE